jgi:hypothetical protein
VPDYQALTAWDEAERKRRQGASKHNPRNEIGAAFDGGSED